MVILTRLFFISLFFGNLILLSAKVDQSSYIGEETGDYYARVVSSSGSIPGVPATISFDHILTRFEFDDGFEGFSHSESETKGKASFVTVHNGALSVRAAWHSHMHRKADDNAKCVRNPVDKTVECNETVSDILSEYPWVDSPVIGPMNTSDSTYIVIRMKHLVRADEAIIRYRNATIRDEVKKVNRYEWIIPNYWEMTFPVQSDGKYHLYAIPITSTRFAVPTFITSFSQLRFYPAVTRSENSLSYPKTDVSYDGTILMDYIRIATAPTILRIEGCSPIISDDSLLGSILKETDTLPQTIHKTIRRGYALNQYFATIDDALKRVNASVDSTLPFASTYNCARQGGDRIVITGLHFGVAIPRVRIDGEICSHVLILHKQVSISCITPPGQRENVIVTISNGDMPVLSDSKPFLSYARGSIPPPRPVITNINAKAVDLSWVCPQDKWDCITTTSYLVQWRMAVLDDVTVGDTSNSDVIAGRVIGTDAAGFIVERPLGSEDPRYHPGTSTSKVHTHSVQSDMISGVGVGRGDNDNDGLADDIYLNGIYIRDSSVDGWKSQSQIVLDEYGEVIPNPTPIHSGYLVDVPSGASYSYTNEALSQTRGTVTPFSDPSISGGTFDKNGVYIPPFERLPHKIAPDIAWGEWGKAPGGGFVIVLNQTSTTIVGLEPGRRYSFRVSALNEPTGLVAFSRAKAAFIAGEIDGGGYLDWAGSKNERYGYRKLPVSNSGAVRSRYSQPSEDIRTLSFDFLFTKFDANNTLDHGPIYKNSSLNSLHWSGGEGHFGLVLVGDAQISNCNSSHTCCDGFGFGSDGGATFADAVRFLDEWEQSRTHSPLYRFDTETMDFTPSSLSWARERAATEGINTGTLPLLMQTGNRGAHSASVRQLAAVDPIINEGFLSNTNSSSLNLTVGDDLIKEFSIKNAGTRPLGHSSDVAGASQPVLHRSRLRTADVLLMRGLGRAPSSQSWFSIFEPKEEPVMAWESYDDAGTLSFVATSVLKKLDEWALDKYHKSQIDLIIENSLYNIAIGNGVNGGTTEFIRWNYPGQGSSFTGIFNDTRVLWDEYTRGPLSPFTEDVIVELNSTNATILNGTNSTFTSNSSLFDQNNTTVSSIVNITNSTTNTTTRTNILTNEKETRYSRQYTTIPRFIHRDRHGRRLVGLDKDPRSSCSLICTSASASRPPVLNSQTQRGTDVYPRGVFAGSRTRGTTLEDNKDIFLVSSDTRMEGIDKYDPYDDDKYFTESTSKDGFSAFGPSAIQGMRFFSANTTILSSNTQEIDYRIGDPDTSTPITGRFSRAVHPLGGVPFPYPDTTFPTSVVIVSAVGSNKKENFSESPSSTRPMATNATAPCGPALRLTASMSSQSGAAWYSRPQQVREGFDTTFIFRISNPSVHCRNMNDANTRCRPRGGSGFAFVFQTMHPAALGNGSSGMGYAGIRKSVAIEFDTFADSELLDPHENHISVQTRGVNFGNSPNHTYSLGHAVLRADTELTDGIHVVRVLYEPNFPKRYVNEPGFMSSSYVSDWLASSEDGGGGTGGYAGSDTGTGMQWEKEKNLGALSIYVDDERSAALIVPISLSKLLGLDDTHGRAWVGFTAGTGADIWQAHDILAWHFTSLRK
jgi:hypothetical protein